MTDVIIKKDNTAKIKKQMEENIQTALEACGLLGEGHAKANLTKFPRVDTGLLRNSITHEVSSSENSVSIGTNVEYAVYVELGTGPLAEGGGRQDVPWFYKSEKDGKVHASYGMAPSHFLKKAVEEHKKDYAKVIKSMLKK